MRKSRLSSGLATMSRNSKAKAYTNTVTNNVGGAPFPCRRSRAGVESRRRNEDALTTSADRSRGPHCHREERPPDRVQQLEPGLPEGEDFIDTQLNGKGMANVGNNNRSNVNIPAYNELIDKARRMPLGKARNALWAKLGADYMRTNAPWVVFMNAARYKFVSTRLRGLVFNGTYYDLFPSLWLAR